MLKEGQLELSAWQQKQVGPATGLCPKWRNESSLHRER